ncbi:MAG: hypothetical protein AAF670_19935 [Planctomycetota bacterium]
MRILTAGAIIVSVAVVSALPFRRTISSSKNDPGLLTGPTDHFDRQQASWTIDDGSEGHLSIADGAKGPGDALHWTRARPSLETPEPPAFSQALPTGDYRQPRRDIRLPLTFEDLAVPESTPHYRDGRFSAVPEMNQRQRIPTNRDRFVAMSPTDVAESGSPQNPWEIETNQPGSVLAQPETPTKKVQPQVDAQLASSASHGPEESVAPRQRHWIKQPQ